MVHTSRTCFDPLRDVYHLSIHAMELSLTYLDTLFAQEGQLITIGYISKVFLPTDAQENCFKKYIKIYIKTAPTCFGANTIFRERIV